MLKTNPFLVVLLFNIGILLLAVLGSLGDSEKMLVIALTGLVLSLIELLVGVIVSIASKSGTLSMRYGIAIMQNSGMLLLVSLTLCGTM